MKNLNQLKDFLGLLAAILFFIVSFKYHRLALAYCSIYEQNNELKTILDSLYDYEDFDFNGDEENEAALHFSIL